jgi:tRNA-dihydrouridine synthase B
VKIGTLTLENKTILAPLAGITNLPFRLIVKEQGCALVCSEMISAYGLVRNSRKTVQMLASAPEEKPLSIQLFGADPDVMAAAAAMVEASGADVLDINFGCSVKKIIKIAAGAALMREPETAEALIKSVRRAVKIPLTIKIRTGWEKSGKQALHLAEVAEACGVDAIALHPRTATQGFGGTADWPLIAAVKQKVSIPVIGNGDIWTADDARNMIEETGCDFIMIGRGAIGNPWIFREVQARLNGRSLPPADLALRFDTMQRYLAATVEYFGEKQACFMMRSRLGWFVKGLPYSSKFREAIKQISSQRQALTLMQSYRDSIWAEEDLFDRGGTDVGVSMR